MTKYDPFTGSLPESYPSWLKGYEPLIDRNRELLFGDDQDEIDQWCQDHPLESREEYQAWWDAQGMRGRDGTILRITQGEWRRLRAQAQAVVLTME